MASLTPEEIDKLTPKQQEALADFEALRARQRLALLGQAQRYHGYYLVPALLFIGVFVALFSNANEKQFIACCLIALSGLIQFHAIGLNQRMDALMKLLDRDLKRIIEDRDV